jgi:hypothetical protein
MIFEKAHLEIALGQKIEAVEGIVPVRLSLVGRCAAIGLMQLRIAGLPISLVCAGGLSRRCKQSFLTIPQHA